MTTKSEISEAEFDYLVTETRTALGVQAIYYACILYERLNIKRRDDIGTLATDGKNIYVNAKYLSDLPIRQRVYAMCHEVEHCVRDHLTQLRDFTGQTMDDGKPFSAKRWNHATDYVINDHLIEANLGEFNPAWLHDRAIGTWEQAPLEVYGRVKDDDPDGGQFDGHMPPDPNAPPRDAMSWKQTVAGAANAAKAAGQLPDNIKSQVDAFLNPPIDWKELVRTTLVKSAGRDTRSYRKPNRRRLAVAPMVWMPGYVGHACGPLVCAVDTSGSVSPREMQVFFGAMSGILSDLSPERLTVIFCDTQVQKVEELTTMADLENLAKDAPRGGGTRFEPPFEYVRDNDVPCGTFIYLTDMRCSFPDQSLAPYPTLWCATSEAVAPWGTTVHVDLDAL